jgi:hypothetical protein
MKLEDAAPIVCQYGKDNKLSSHDAAIKIINDVVLQKNSLDPPEQNSVSRVQGLVKQYRDGAGLEDITKRILDIVDPGSQSLMDAINDAAFNFKFNFSNPLLGSSSGSFGCPTGHKGPQGPAGGPLTSSVHQIGDLVENKNTLQPLPDKTWLWADGSYVFEDDYPTLYQILQNNAFYGMMYAYVFDEQIEPFTSRTKFNLPTVPLNMIKAL